MRTRSTNKTPQEILNMIIKNEIYKNYSFIIMGKSGPTGKTWLTHELRERGYNATEISEHINDLVEYKDNRNHVILKYTRNLIFIILNRPLERKPKKEIKLVLDDDVSSINLVTNVKDGNGLLMAQSKHLLSDFENGDEFDLRI